MVKALPFIHQQKRVEEKGNDVLAADWLCQTHEKLSYFFMGIGTAFLMAGNPCRTP